MSPTASLTVDPCSLAPTIQPVTKPTDNPASSPLREAQDRFIAVWGQMGSSWGISRTMAEVHALLFITGEAMCTDDVMDRLEISRGNASMTLRALVEWAVISREHRKGDRKEYFVAEQDIWTMFRAIMRERLKREVDPLVISLYEIRSMTEEGAADQASGPEQLEAHHERVDELLTFLTMIERLGQKFVSPSGSGLQAAAKVLAATTGLGTGRKS